MFASIELAQQIEAAAAVLVSSIADAIQQHQARPDVRAFPIGRGVAVYAAPMSPMNKMIGVGLGDGPTEAELDAAEAHFTSMEEPLQAEVSTLADPAFMRQLVARGYRLEGFESVLARSLAVPLPAAPVVPGMQIRQMTEAEDGDWLRASVTGFLHADTQGVAAAELPPADHLEKVVGDFLLASGFLRYGAWIDGVLAAVGSMRIDGALAQMCGATTLPQFRRCGIQTALFRMRLALAADAGCTLAVVTTQPGSKSNENACRQGFETLYDRALLVRPPSGSEGAGECK